MSLYTLYTDGACSNNPGPCGAGAVMLGEMNTIAWTYSEYLGPSGTNNIGECTAILRGLTRAKEMNVTNLRIYSDSELCVELIKGKKKAKKEHLIVLLDKCKDAMEGMSVDIQWVKGHAGIHWNEYADRLANQALEAGRGTIIVTDKSPKMEVSEMDEKHSFKKPYDNNKSKLILNCPFNEKDEVKKLGARWNADMKKWTIIDSVENREKFAKWI